MPYVTAGILCFQISPSTGKYQEDTMSVLGITDAAAKCSVQSRNSPITYNLIEN